jgi:hypothetical protein
VNPPGRGTSGRFGPGGIGTHRLAPAAAPRSPGRALLAVVADAALVSVAGFCAIAMGLGRPFWLFMIGLAAVGGFRARLRAWWGLATAIAAFAAAVGLLYGFGVMLIVEVSIGLFLIVAITRLATHRQRAPGSEWP